jgi:hypothetical protein
MDAAMSNLPSSFKRGGRRARAGPSSWPRGLLIIENQAHSLARPWVRVVAAVLALHGTRLYHDSEPQAGSLSASAADEPRADSAHGHQRRLGPVPVSGQIGDGDWDWSPIMGACLAHAQLHWSSSPEEGGSEEGPTTALDFGC